MILPVTSEHFYDGDQEEAIDELNEDHEEVVVDELCCYKVIRVFHLVLAKEASQLSHVWVVRCDLIVRGVDDCSDDVDQERNSLGVQCIEQEFLPILPEWLL